MDSKRGACILTWQQVGQCHQSWGLAVVESLPESIVFTAEGSKEEEPDLVSALPRNWGEKVSHYSGAAFSNHHQRLMRVRGGL